MKRILNIIRGLDDETIIRIADVALILFLAAVFAIVAMVLTGRI